jgi:hypothetical protein
LPAVRQLDSEPHALGISPRGPTRRLVIGEPLPEGVERAERAAIIEAVTIWFNAVFELGTAFETPERLRTQLAEEPAGIRETVERYRHEWRATVWTLEPCSDRPMFYKILGPGGFSLMLSPRVADLHHVMTFGRFTFDAEERALLRRSCLVIANLLGSSRALLMPELTPTRFYDGVDIAAIEENLRARIGRPASTWEELHDSERFTPGSWYIDDFADLR